MLEVVKQKKVDSELTSARRMACWRMWSMSFAIDIVSKQFVKLSHFVVLIILVPKAPKSNKLIKFDPVQS